MSSGFGIAFMGIALLAILVALFVVLRPSLRNNSPRVRVSSEADRKHGKTTQGGADASEGVRAADR